MTLALLAVAPKHERRVRLIFSGPLAGGAFTPAHYAFVSLSALGPSPNVSAALQVAGSANVVELVLSQDLARGGLYTATATDVPAMDTSTATATERFLFGAATALRTNVEPAKNDLEPLLFGRDLVWTGSDWGETADGDLATTEGLPNACAALERRLLASGLPWQADYGPNLDEAVDGPAVGASTTRGAITQQMLRDPRVTAATVTLQIRDAADGSSQAFFDVELVLLGGRRPPPFSRQVT